MRRSLSRSGIVALLLAGTLAVSERAVHAQPAGAAESKLQPLDVIYVPTPDTVVAKMLSMARVGPGDVVYDLGSGDGRIVIAAVKNFSAARGVGYELDPVRNTEARANAAAAGVSDKVQFIAENLFDADLSGATVITTYLLPVLNERLVPTFRKLRPGTRIVTHNYDLTGDWKPVEKVVIDGHIVYSFVVPRR